MIDEGEPPSWVEYTMSVKLNSTIEIVDGDNVDVGVIVGCERDVRGCHRIIIT